MNYQSVITLNTKSRTELTWWIESLRFCNDRTFSQLNPQVIIQTYASLTRWGAVYNGVPTSVQWSEEERTLHINVLELLAIKLALVSFSKWKKMKAIHFQKDNKAAWSYLLKMGGTKNDHIRLIKEIWHYLLNHNMAITAEYLPSVLNIVADRIKNKTRLFRVTSLSQSFSSGFSTTKFSNNRFIYFRPMPSTTSIYSLASRSLQGRDRCNDTKLEHRSSLCISHFQYDFNSAFKNETGMCFSSDSDCNSLEYPTMVPITLKPCVREPVLLPQGQEILLSPKNIVHPLMVENSLTLAAWLVSGKPFCGKEFKKTLLTLSQIPDEGTQSLIMSQPRENGLACVLNEKLIHFRHL